MTKWIAGQALINRFEEEWVPKKLAFANDKIGLLIGSLKGPVRRVMVTLDVLENVVAEAADKDVDLIIAHHPVIFHPLAQVRTDEGQGKIVSQCIQHQIAVYAAHTNLDIADGGVNDMLAEKLGLGDVAILKETYREPLYKFTTFVPEDQADAVRTALGQAGAGTIGNYSCCSYSASGEGCFLPMDNAAPFIGKPGQLEKVTERRLEAIVPEHLLQAVSQSVRRVHPYEQPVYDVYPLQNKGKAYGLGRIGRLDKSISFGEYCQSVKECLGLEGLRAVGDLNAPVQTIAVSGGDGNSLIPYARYRGADVLITGDVYYHTAHDALLSGLKVIDAGHHIESVMKQGVQRMLQAIIAEAGKQTEVICSEARTNPFQFIV